MRAWRRGGLSRRTALIGAPLLRFRGLGFMVFEETHVCPRLCFVTRHYKAMYVEFGVYSHQIACSTREAGQVWTYMPHTRTHIQFAGAIVVVVSSV